MIPSCDQTGTPGLVAFTHFNSSTTSGSASLIRARIRESISPLQSPSFSILASISSDGDSALSDWLFSIYLHLLAASIGAGGGTRTPDTRIMIGWRQGSEGS